MIQITLRRTNGGAQENSVQRPERPTRAYPNSSPPRSFIIHAGAQPREVWREDLSRPNAPAHDETYNNRSISPLFVGVNNHRQNGFLYMYRPPNLVGSNHGTVTTSSSAGLIPYPRQDFPPDNFPSDSPTPEAPQDLSQLSRSPEARSSIGRSSIQRNRLARIVPYAKPRQSEDSESSSNGEPSSRESTLLKAVLAALECPVCRDYATPPIRLCRVGHMLCANCRSRLTACPECRGPLLSIRARGLEDIAAIVDFPCSNAGCQTGVPLTARLQHSVTCAFRRFPCIFCPEGECAWEGLKSELMAHGLYAHSDSVTLESTTNFVLELSSEERKDVIINCFNELFQIVFIVDVSKRMVFGTIRKLCDSEQSREFLATICCESPGPEPRAMMTYSHVPLAETTLTHSKATLTTLALFRLPFVTLSELMDANLLSVSVSISRTNAYKGAPADFSVVEDRVSPSR